MIDISKIKVGDKVHYIPFAGSKFVENGIVKEIPTHTLEHVRVVYHCAGEWERFMDYTSALTPIERLFMGWPSDDADLTWDAVVSGFIKKEEI